LLDEALVAFVPLILMVGMGGLLGTGAGAVAVKKRLTHCSWT